MAGLSGTWTPKGENVLTGINFGQGLPRALALKGVPVTSVSDLASYGVMSEVPGVETQAERDRMLEVFSRIYSPTIGTGPVMDYLSQTGQNVLAGADILRSVPEGYSSSVEYGDTPVAKMLKSVAQVHLANLGTQIFYTQHGSFDTHFNQVPMHTRLWTDVGQAIGNFFDDLHEHEAGDNVIMMLFTEFGRRVKDNGTGTDHGAGGNCLRHGRPGERRDVWYLSVAEAGGPEPGRPGAQLRLPRVLCLNRGTVAGVGLGAHRRRKVRTA